jgi:hypothetical protein
MERRNRPMKNLLISVIVALCITYAQNAIGDAQITLYSSSISVNGSGATASGNKVTITSAGLYTISGSISWTDYCRHTR